jgi:shikimate 5-dehydrogenase
VRSVMRCCSAGRHVLTLCVRNPERAHHTAEVMSHWSLDVEVVPLTELDSVDLPQLVASTLPGNAEGFPAMPERVVATAALFDVAYSPWPSGFCPPMGKLAATDCVWPLDAGLPGSGADPVVCSRGRVATSEG